MSALVQIQVFSIVIRLMEVKFIHKNTVY